MRRAKLFVEPGNGVLGGCLARVFGKVALLPFFFFVDGIVPVPSLLHPHICQRTKDVPPMTIQPGQRTIRKRPLPAPRIKRANS